MTTSECGEQTSLFTPGPAPYARLGKRGAVEHIGVRLWRLIIVAGTYGSAKRACV